ncbi:RDD family protein [Singulisphaera sp. Ch08]|uniref:RDD family protein n=1 Tax=Singulisphaera sp. Ch08 TaxID=3120278 RepID=A0AAU7CNX9_9BACT
MSYVNDADFNPYAAPKAAPGGYGSATQAPVEYAGFWVRFVALVIDGLIVFVINFVVGFSIQLLGAAAKLDPAIGALVSSLLSIVIQICYYPLMVSSEKQASYGKIMMGLKVTDLAGRRISFGRALGREFAKILSAIIFMIGYIMAAFTERKQALHDMIAGTLVVKAR